jgi:rhodanese-related sulfurtransferase
VQHDPLVSQIVEHAEAFLALVEDAKTRIREISVDEVAAKLRNQTDFELIDVREDHEWQQGRIRGAKHLGRGILERDIEKAIPNKDREIVLYCGGGFRSALSADNLQSMGYRNVYSMAGGFRGWKSSNGPTE